LLIVGSAAVALSTLAASLVVGIWTSWMRESARITQELSVSAGLIAHQIARDTPRGQLSLLPLRGESAAAAALASLQNDPRVHTAKVLTAATAPDAAPQKIAPDTTVAQWARRSAASGPLGSDEQQDFAAGDRSDFLNDANALIEVRALIERQGVPLGTVVLTGYRPSLWTIAAQDLTWALPGALVALLFSLLFGLRLAAFIMQPMRQLASATRVAGREGDYSVRVPLPGDPELAAVAREFNQMADLVGQRDAMLEAKVQERTAALEAARAAADAANNAKTRFLALMSHEMRTPLHGVIGSADVLGQAALTTRDLVHVQHIQHSAQALQGIVNDVLQLTGQEGGRPALVLADTSVAELLREVAVSHAAAAQAKGLGWHMHLAANCDASRRVDADRLRQVLDKLLANAVKFTHSGQIVLEGRVDHAQRLLVSVVDTGEGFDLQELPRLLRPFEQAQSTAARRHEGSGLGLAIAQHVSNLLDASLSFDSSPGQGTRALLSLSAPLAQTSSLPNSSHLVVAAQARPAQYLGPILVVEDNEVNQFVITAMLERLGAAQVHVASSGAQALQMSEQAAYDLVLMDWQMPEMDGLEVIARLRAKEAADTSADAALRRLPIVALTANAMPGDRERCLQAGADGYLSKPLLLEDLRLALAQFYRFARAQPH
jgi:two-component system, sensor histidine kinase